MNTVNFTARLVDRPTIQHRNSLFAYKQENASIVELECADKNDMRVLSEISSDWMNKGGRYVDSIFNRAMFSSNLKSNDKINHYYALTTQTKNFENLKSDSILGMMLFSENSYANNEIDLLEVNPYITKKNNFFRKYKQVGKKLVQFVQENFPQKNIQVWSDYRSKDFYKKLGFERQSKDVCDLCWRHVR